MERLPKLISSQFWTSRCGRVLLLSLLVTAILLTSFITHRPQSLWARLTYIAPPAAPPAALRFVTLPPGSKLPNEFECASRIRRNSWEPRQDNYIANRQVPSARQIASLAAWDAAIGQDPEADAL